MARKMTLSEAKNLPLPLKLMLQNGGVSFYECLLSCVRHKEFVAEYDRLSGTNLSLKGSALDLAIDDATGRTTGELPGFIDFVFETVFIRLMPDTPVPAPEKKATKKVKSETSQPSELKT